MMPAFCVEFLTHHVINCLGPSQSIATFAMNFSSHWTFQPEEVESSGLTIIATGEDPILGYWDVSGVLSAPIRSVASMVFKPLLYIKMCWWIISSYKFLFLNSFIFSTLIYELTCTDSSEQGQCSNENNNQLHFK